MNHRRISAAQLGTGLALCVLIVGMLLYGSAHREQPAESEVHISHIATDMTTTSQDDAITKPSQTTTMPAASATEVTVTAGRYDLNLVTKEELMRIPDMTEALADGILELRTVIQYYTHLYEVLYVEGMNGVYVDDVLANHLYVTPREP